jgi:glucokinase
VSRIGIDVGGTKCLGVALDSTGKVAREVRRPTPHADQLVDQLWEMYEELGADGALGIGVPGLITPEGVIRASPNMQGAYNIEVGPQLRDRIGNVVTVDNDATMAAFGEWRNGAARGTDDALIVTLGTGIGGGIVMGGQIQRGAHGFAGEIGHMTVERDGVVCPCGLRGCWERYASGSALIRLSEGMSGEELFERFNNGDLGAAQVVDTFIDWIVVGLAGLTNVCDPQVIVLGGGVITSLDRHFDRVRARFGEALYSSKWRPHPRVEPAQLGEYAGAIGSAVFAGELAK